MKPSLISTNCINTDCCRQISTHIYLKGRLKINVKNFLYTYLVLSVRNFDVRNKITKHFNNNEVKK